MSRFSPYTARIETHMYKSWIRENPELALKSVEQFCLDAAELGMRFRIIESEHYVDIIAAKDDKYLYGDMA